MEVYKHSGRAPVGGISLGAIMGLTAGAILAVVYAYSIAYIPIVGYFTFILSIGFGGLLALFTAGGLRLGKVRNGPISTAVGITVGLIAFYISWAVWVYATLGRADVELSLVALIMQPKVVWELVGTINELGAWSIKSFTPTGAVLWALWGVEALLIIGPSLLIAIINSDPFCERCNTWCSKEQRLKERTLGDVDPGLLKDPKSWRGLRMLDRLSPRAPDDTDWLRLDLHVCDPECRKTQALDVVRVSTRQDSDGQMKEDVESIVQGLLLSNADVDRLRTVSTNAAAPIEPLVGTDAFFPEA